MIHTVIYLISVQNRVAVHSAILRQDHFYLKRKKQVHDLQSGSIPISRSGMTELPFWVNHFTDYGNPREPSAGSYWCWCYSIPGRCTKCLHVIPNVDNDQVYCILHIAMPWLGATEQPRIHSSGHDLVHRPPSSVQRQHLLLRVRRWCQQPYQ